MSLSDFEEVIDRTIRDNEPTYLAGYALDLAKAFSKAYLELKVIGEPEAPAQARLALFEATRIVLTEAVELLGMVPLERM